MNTTPIDRTLMNICNYPGCENAHKCRGLCKTHYDITREMIIHGQTTEQELMAAGIWETRRTGRPLKNLEFRNWVAGRLGNQKRRAA